MARPNVWRRVLAWMRLAYTDITSKEHHILLEWIVWTVIVSVVVTVLQHDEQLDAEYHLLFKMIETFILITFSVDYAFNIYYAENKRRYITSFAGIVDLVSIMPSFLVYVDLAEVKFLRSLRFLRFLRILQVAKAVREQSPNSQGGEVIETTSLVLDLQLSVIGISAALLLVPDNALRNLLLVVTLVIAVTTGLRRWLVHHQFLTLSVLVLLATVVSAMMYAIHLDEAGHSEWAVGLLLGTVIVTLFTALRVEGPAGGL